LTVDDRIYVGHMLETASKALRIVESKTRADYDQDETLRLALTHLVQVIGEASRLVSKQFRDQHDRVPWDDIAGMRHRIVHDYLRVDEDIVWKTVTEDMPSLIALLQQALA